MTKRKDPKDFKKKGRPTKYKKQYSTKRLEEYLDSCKDGEKKIVVQENTEKGYTMYKSVPDIKLPSIEGYAIFLGIGRDSLYDWEKVNPEFAVALEKIRSLQKEKLIKHGLEGTYNSTIAKLILSTNHGMHENNDITSKGDKISTFSDDQVNRIADRITKRRATNGDTGSA